MCPHSPQLFGSVLNIASVMHAGGQYLGSGQQSPSQQ
jgi:hypothetical protein